MKRGREIQGEKGHGEKGRVKGEGRMFEKLCCLLSKVSPTDKAANFIV
jgi:hypothetical protein